MKNYDKATIGNEGRVELHETLGLTGAEVSINQLPASTPTSRTRKFMESSPARAA